MNSRDTDPEDVDATFAAIVADLRAEGGAFADEDVPGQPATERPTEPEPVRHTGGSGDGDKSGDHKTGDQGGDQAVPAEEPGSDDEHYVPPEPPPLPRPGKGAFVVLLLFVAGLFMLIAPGVIGVSTAIGTPLGILALAAAIALSLLRVKQGPPDGDGAQV